MFGCELLGDCGAVIAIEGLRLIDARRVGLRRRRRLAELHWACWTVSRTPDIGRRLREREAADSIDFCRAEGRPRFAASAAMMLEDRTADPMVDGTNQEQGSFPRATRAWSELDDVAGCDGVAIGPGLELGTVQELAQKEYFVGSEHAPVLSSELPQFLDPLSDEVDGKLLFVLLLTNETGLLGVGLAFRFDGSERGASFAQLLKVDSVDSLKGNSYKPAVRVARLSLAHERVEHGPKAVWIGDRQELSY